MPAKSRQQQQYLAHKFGAAWLRKHHFDTKGPLPEKASPVTQALAKRRR